MCFPCSPSQNFGEECTRLRYFVTNAEIAGCTIEVRQIVVLHAVNAWCCA